VTADRWGGRGSRMGLVTLIRAVLGIDRPARDRTARCWLHWCRRGSSRLHPVIPGSAARSRVEVRPSAHDRGGAPKGERAPSSILPRKRGRKGEKDARRIRWQACFFCGGAEPSGAPVGAPPPSFLREVLGRAFLQRDGKLGCEGASRGWESLFTSPRVRGEHRRPPDAVLQAKNSDPMDRLRSEATRMRGPLRDAERRGPSESAADAAGILRPTEKPPHPNPLPACGERERALGASEQRSTHAQRQAKLSGPADAGGVAGAALSPAPSVGVAGAIRSVRNVPFLQRQALPPAPPVLRPRGPRGVPEKGLARAESRRQRGSKDDLEGIGADPAADGIALRAPDGAGPTAAMAVTGRTINAGKAGPPTLREGVFCANSAANLHLRPVHCMRGAFLTGRPLPAVQSAGVIL